MFVLRCLRYLSDIVLLARQSIVLLLCERLLILPFLMAVFAFYVSLSLSLHCRSVSLELLFIIIFRLFFCLNSLFSLYFLVLVTVCSTSFLFIFFFSTPAFIPCSFFPNSLHYPRTSCILSPCLSSFIHLIHPTVFLFPSLRSSLLFPNNPPFHPSPLASDRV